MKIVVTRSIGFDAGHTVTKHESKCAHLHGHRYTAEITCAAEQLDGIGRVIDFSVIKAEIGGWIDRNWDHKFLISDADHRASSMLTMDPASIVMCSYNPTAENMANALMAVAAVLMMPYGIEVTHIRLYETPNGWVDVHA
jgi:6-pyruvoyltetrahydropterin/6-carboxytetrahydropterin synthase